MRTPLFYCALAALLCCPCKAAAETTAEESAPQERPAKKTSAGKRAKKESGYKFKAEDPSLYVYDKDGRPLKVKKAPAKKKKKSPGGGYKFRQDAVKSSYKFDELADPIEKPVKKKAPKKPAAKKAEPEPPHADSLPVDKKTLNLREE